MSKFKHGDPATLSLANKLNYKISFFQVPSNLEVSFKSMLTNFSDDFSCTWDRKEVYGRMDPIQVFQGTRRSINLAWDVVSTDAYEARENMRKISILMNMLYPSYEADGNTAGLINTAPVFKIKFLNLITDTGNTQQGAAGDAKTSGLVGTVDGFQFTPSLEYGFHGTPPDMLVQTEGVSSTAIKDELSIYPKVINMSCVFHVTHTHKLGWTTTGEARSAGFPYDVRANEVIPEFRTRTLAELQQMISLAERVADEDSVESSRVLDEAFDRLSAAPVAPDTRRQLEKIGANLRDETGLGESGFKNILETKAEDKITESINALVQGEKKRRNAQTQDPDLLQERLDDKIKAKLERALLRRGTPADADRKRY